MIVQLEKEHSTSGRPVLSDSESMAAFSDKFIVKSKFIADYFQHLDVMEFKKKKRGEGKGKPENKGKSLR